MSNASKVQPFRNNFVTPRKNSSDCGRIWRTPARAATMLALSLCCAGCVHGPGSPSISQAPQGNAVLMVLPAGTVLELPTKEASDMARALFVNELSGRSADCSRPVGISRIPNPQTLSNSNGLPTGSRRYGRLETCATNELAPTGWGAANGGEDVGVRPPRLTLTKPLRLASPAYILDRDLREMELLQRVEELKVENLQLRGK